MRKYLFITIGIVIVLVAGVTIYLALQPTRQAVQQPHKSQIAPSLNLKSSNSQANNKMTKSATPLAIQSVEPAPEATVSPDLNQIIINLEQPQQAQDLSLILVPSQDYTLAVKDKQVVIALSQPLETGTEYYYSLERHDQLGGVHAYTFTTTGATPTPAPTWPHHDLFEKTDAANLEHAPDIFLSSRMPHEAGTFKIDSYYDDEIDGLLFTVTSTIGDIETSKIDLQDWLISLGLKSDQIDKLNLIYEE